MTSSLLLSLTTFAYLLCTVLYLAGTIFRFKPLLGAGAISGAATLLMQTAGIGLRWVESYRMGYGHAPLSNMYESLVFASWAIMIIYLVFEWRIKQRALGVFPALFSFLAMAYASFSKDVDSKIQPLVPALKSNWLIAHVMTCFLGYAAFAVSFGLSLLYLVRKRFPENPNPHGGFAAFLPGASQLEWFNYQTGAVRVLVAFSRNNNGVRLGQLGLGHLLELGPQGNLVPDNLAHIRRPAPRAQSAGLEGRKSGLAVNNRFWVCSIYLFWGKLSIERVA